MKKKYVIPSIVQEFMEESLMIAASLNYHEDEFAGKNDEVLVKGQDAVYSSTTVEWDDWE